MTGRCWRRVCAAGAHGDDGCVVAAADPRDGLHRDGPGVPGQASPSVVGEVLISKSSRSITRHSEVTLADYAWAAPSGSATRSGSRAGHNPRDERTAEVMKAVSDFIPIASGLDTRQ
jgi:hypothetical protein